MSYAAREKQLIKAVAASGPPAKRDATVVIVSDTHSHPVIGRQLTQIDGGARQRFDDSEERSRSIEANVLLAMRAKVRGLEAVAI